MQRQSVSDLYSYCMSVIVDQCQPGFSGPACNVTKCLTTTVIVYTSVIVYECQPGFTGPACNVSKCLTTTVSVYMSVIVDQCQPGFTGLASVSDL